MHPTFIPNRERLLELCDQPDGIVQWARETLAQYDRLRGSLGVLTELEAEHARLDWQDAPLGNSGVAKRQEALRTLRHLPGGIETVARYLDVTLDQLVERTWPSMRTEQVLLVEELGQDPALARRQIALLAHTTLPFLDIFFGPDDRNATNRQIRELIAECVADGLSLEETRAALKEAGHEVPYKRVWESYKRLAPKAVGE